MVWPYVVVIHCRRSYYKELWTAVVAEEDLVNHGGTTSRNVQASRCWHCCTSQMIEVDGQSSQRMYPWASLTGISQLVNYILLLLWLCLLISKSLRSRPTEHPGMKAPTSKADPSPNTKMGVVTTAKTKPFHSWSELVHKTSEPHQHLCSDACATDSCIPWLLFDPVMTSITQRQHFKELLTNKMPIFSVQGPGTMSKQWLIK